MDSTPPRRSTLAVVIAIVTALYWLAIFVGTHLPVTPDPNRVPNSLDKLQHITAFALLAALLCTSVARRVASQWQLLAGVILVIALYGIFDEATQAFVPHREPDLFDWLADMIGAALGVAAFSLGRRFVKL